MPPAPPHDAVSVVDEADLAARALAWIRASRESVCDVIEPWEHGTVLRASRYPSWYNLNLVRVEDEPGMSVSQLISFSDRALAGLEHRMISFERARAAEPLRADLEAAGWTFTRLVWMHHKGPRSVAGYADGPSGQRVCEVEYDAVAGLRSAWHAEDFPGRDPSEFHAEVREVALARGSRVLAIVEDAQPIAYAGLDLGEDGIEIGAVYVRPDYRGRGQGTAVTRAAIAAAGDVAHLWISADADDRPKELYARLGFRPVMVTVDVLRLPEG
jgi:ribosomal protein S18 acetylase RimI-like enzyme